MIKPWAKRLKELSVHLLQKMKQHWPRIKKVLKWTFIVILAGLSLGCLFVAVLLSDDRWDDYDPAKLENVQQTLRIYDKNGDMVAGVYNQNRIVVPLSKMPLYAREALIDTEDTRFYSHPGVDILRIPSTLIADLKKRSLAQGASTITQQLVRTTYLTTEKTWTRKITEALLALQVERRYTKDEILEMYLNTVYFGNGAYGIEAAAQAYFGKSAMDLSLSECALLIGVLKGPGIYAPHIDAVKSVTRRNLILSLMVDAGSITEEQMNAAKKEPVVLDMKPAMPSSYGYYVDACIDEAMNVTGRTYDELISEGYKIYTSLNPALQSFCDDLMSDDSYFPADASDGTEVQGALVIMNANDGSIQAVVGGREYTSRRILNRATSSRRQPGSAIKPLIAFGPALDQYHYSPATLVLDEPDDFNGYSPQDTGAYRGWVTLRTALSKSLNLPAVRVLADIGIDNGKQFASQAGIPFDPADTNLSLALGGFTSGVTPVELASAYTAFAAEGRYSKGYFVSEIRTAGDQTVYKVSPVTRTVASAEGVFLLNDVLQETVRTGTATKLQEAGIPLAAKTGTVGYTKGNRDAWLVAYNPEYIAVSWIGFDKTDDQHYLPASATGGNYTAALVAKIFSYLYQNEKAPTFTMPPGVVKCALDKKAMDEEQELMLAPPLTPSEFVYEDYFAKGSEPTDYSPYWQAPTAPGEISVSLNDLKQPVVTIKPTQSKMRYDLYRRDENGTDTLVAQYNYQDTIIWTDTSVTSGTWRYFFVAVNPNLNISSTPSTEGSVTITQNSSIWDWFQR